jgi:phage repressor protein C with HTH and peptisase S24 domain
MVQIERVKATGLTQFSALDTQHLNPDEILPELVREVVSKGVECRLQAKGNSMSPFIKDGDMITILPSIWLFPKIWRCDSFYPSKDRKTIHS